MLSRCAVIACLMLDMSLWLNASSSETSTTSLPISLRLCSSSNFDMPSRKKRSASASSRANVDLPMPCAPASTTMESALHPGWSARATSWRSISSSTSVVYSLPSASSRRLNSLPENVMDSSPSTRHVSGGRRSAPHAISMLGSSSMTSSMGLNRCSGIIWYCSNAVRNWASDRMPRPYSMMPYMLDTSPSVMGRGSGSRLHGSGATFHGRRSITSYFTPADMSGSASIMRQTSSDVTFFRRSAFSSSPPSGSSRLSALPGS